MQTIDPWPAEAANRAIETNGERMQRAIERYRTNKTTSLATAPSAAAPATPALTPTPQLTAPPTQ